MAKVTEELITGPIEQLINGYIIDVIKTLFALNQGIIAEPENSVSRLERDASWASVFFQSRLISASVKVDAAMALGVEAMK